MVEKETNQIEAKVKSKVVPKPTVNEVEIKRIENRLSVLSAKRIQVADYVNTVGSKGRKIQAFSSRVISKITDEEISLKNQLAVLKKGAN